MIVSGAAAIGGVALVISSLLGPPQNEAAMVRPQDMKLRFSNKVTSSVAENPERLVLGIADGIEAVPLEERTDLSPVPKNDVHIAASRASAPPESRTNVGIWNRRFDMDEE